MRKMYTRGMFLFFFFLFMLPSRKVYAAGDNDKLNVPATIFVTQPGLLLSTNPSSLLISIFN